MLRKRTQTISNNIEQGGLTKDALSLLGLKIPFEVKTKKPALETQTGERAVYDLHDPRQADIILPLVEEALDKVNKSKVKYANKNLYEDRVSGVLTSAGEQAVLLEAKSRILQRLLDVARAEIGRAHV